MSKMNEDDLILLLKKRGIILESIFSILDETEDTIEVLIDTTVIVNKKLDIK